MSCQVLVSNIPFRGEMTARPVGSERSCDGFRAHVGVASTPQSTATARRARAHGHCHIDNHASGQPSHTEYRTRILLLLLQKLTGHPRHLAIDSRVRPETPMSPNRVVPPCLQFPPIPNAAIFHLQREKALTHLSIMSASTRSLPAMAHTPPGKLRWRRGPSWVSRPCGPRGSHRTANLTLVHLQAPREECTSRPGFPSRHDHPIMSHYCRKFLISHPPHRHSAKTGLVAGRTARP
ncbi:hypothetical protein V8C26DRAFT_291566 [Trichoderma gracile]